MSDDSPRSTGGKVMTIPRSSLLNRQDAKLSSLKLAETSEGEQELAPEAATDADRC